MITEDYVSFETAKLLKKNGFDEPCHALYHNGEDKIFFGLDVDSYHNTNLNVDYYACPTLQMAMKYLREIHSLFIEISVDEMLRDKGYQWALYDNITKEIMPYSGWGNTYEEACEAAIKYYLENLI